MRLIAVPCQVGHILSIQMPEVGLADTRQNIVNEPTAPQLLARYAKTLMAEDRVLGAIGVFPRWEGVGYGWAMLSEEARWFHGLSITRETRRALLYAEVELGMKRIESTVKVDYPAGIDWLERMGFVNETPAGMKNFGPGAVGDYYLYARVRA